MMEMIQNYWKAVLAQDEEAMRRYLHPDALIRWHNTKEQFTREEFIRVNCEYPGKWSGKILHFFPIDNGCLTIVQVIGTDASFHVTSILHKKDSSMNIGEMIKKRQHGAMHCWLKSEITAESI